MQRPGRGPGSSRPPAGSQLTGSWVRDQGRGHPGTPPDTGLTCQWQTCPEQGVASPTSPGSRPRPGATLGTQGGKITFTRAPDVRACADAVRPLSRPRCCGRAPSPLPGRRHPGVTQPHSHPPRAPRVRPSMVFAVTVFPSLRALLLLSALPGPPVFSLCSAPARVSDPLCCGHAHPGLTSWRPSGWWSRRTRPSEALLGCARTFTLFKDAQLTRRARWGAREWTGPQRGQLQSRGGWPHPPREAPRLPGEAVAGASPQSPQGDPLGRGFCRQTNLAGVGCGHMRVLFPRGPSVAQTWRYRSLCPSGPPASWVCVDPAKL